MYKNIAATENGKHFESTLNGALDAVERQVRERRKQQRNYQTRVMDCITKGT